MVYAGVSGFFTINILSYNGGIINRKAGSPGAAAGMKRRIFKKYGKTGCSACFL